MKKWKDIKDFEGYYQVSNHGEVKSIAREVPAYNRFNSYEYKVKEKILKPNNRRYCGVTLVKDGNRKYPTVHRLVAETFLPNPHDKKTVNHKDGNKHNNNLSNLEWMTMSENILHSYHILNRKRRTKITI